MPNEVPATLKLYLEGKVEQFWFREKGGPIFLINVELVEQARATLDALPLVANGLMSYELIPVGPLAPFGMLIAKPTARTNEQDLVLASKCSTSFRVIRRGVSWLKETTARMQRCPFD